MTCSTCRGDGYVLITQDDVGQQERCPICSPDDYTRGVDDERRRWVKVLTKESARLQRWADHEAASRGRMPPLASETAALGAAQLLRDVVQKLTLVCPSCGTCCTPSRVIVDAGRTHCPGCMREVVG